MPVFTPVSTVASPPATTPAALSSGTVSTVASPPGTAPAAPSHGTEVTRTTTSATTTTTTTAPTTTPSVSFGRRRLPEVINMDRPGSSQQSATSVIPISRGDAYANRRRSVADSG